MSEFYQFAVDKFIFRVKKGLLYSKDDVWVKIEESHVRIGVTDFHQMSGGDILFVELPKVGSKVKHLEAVAQFETIKAVYEVVSPLGGAVAETNKKLEDKPEIINEDPYGEGWLFQLSPDSFGEDARQLLTAEQYFELMKGKIETERKKL